MRASKLPVRFNCSLHTTLQIEYDPAPPFDSGSPNTASADLVGALRARGVPQSGARSATALRDHSNAAAGGFKLAAMMP